MTCWTKGTPYNVYPDRFQRNSLLVYDYDPDNTTLALGITNTIENEIYYSDDYGLTWQLWSGTSPDYNTIMNWNGTDVAVGVYENNYFFIGEDQIRLFRYKLQDDTGIACVNDIYSNVVGIGKFNYLNSANRVESKIINYSDVALNTNVSKYRIQFNSKVYITGNSEMQFGLCDFFAVQPGDTSWTPLTSGGSYYRDIFSSDFDFYKDIIVIARQSGSSYIQHAVEIIPAIPTFNKPFQTSGSSYIFNWTNNSNIYDDHIVIHKGTLDNLYTDRTRAFKESDYGSQLIECDDTAPSKFYPFIMKSYGNCDDLNYYASQQTSIFGEPFETTPPEAPSGLTYLYSTNSTISIEWTNNGDISNNVIPQIYLNGSWTDAATLDPSATTYTYTGLTLGTTYQLRVSNYALDTYYSSSSIEAETAYPQSLCLCEPPEYYLRGRCYWTEEYEEWIDITGATCGNSDGVIDIKRGELFEFFDITLSSWDGSTPRQFNYLYGDPQPTLATGLTAGFYQINLFTKPEYESVYGDGCSIGYVPVPSSGSTMTQTSLIKKPIQCGPFDKQSGRIIWKFDDTNPSTTYSQYIFEKPKNPYNYWGNVNDNMTSSGDSYTNNYAFVNTIDGSQTYYVLIENNDNNCRLLLGPENNDKTETVSSIGGIRRLFITPYSNDIDYNYWKTSDEDFYLEAEDASQFISTKIKEYYSKSGGTLQWYKIPVIGTMSYNQSFSRERQGITLEDTLNVDVPKTMIDRFDEITSLLGNRWVIIMEDNMGQIWTFGYAIGVDVIQYTKQTGLRDGENKYSFQFKGQSADKLLVGLDYNWYYNNILN